MTVTSRMNVCIPLDYTVISVQQLRGNRSLYLQVLQTRMYTTMGSLLLRACCLHSSFRSFQSVKIPRNTCQYIYGKGPSYFLLPFLLHCQSFLEPGKDVSLSICVSLCLHFHQDTRNTYCSLLQAFLCPEGGILP